MRVTITGRHFDLTDALKARIEEKLAKLERFSLRIPEAHVTLAVEKYRHKAEIVLHVNHSVMTSKEESADMYVSVDAAIDKLQRMLRKYKTKHAPKPPKGGIVPPSSVEEEEEEFDEEE
jgi:putative sigma-54 modulation protein